MTLFVQFFFVRSRLRIWRLSSVTFVIFWVCERAYGSNTHSSYVHSINLIYPFKNMMYEWVGPQIHTFFKHYLPFVKMFQFYFRNNFLAGSRRCRWHDRLLVLCAQLTQGGGAASWTDYCIRVQSRPYRLHWRHEEYRTHDGCTERLVKFSVLCVLVYVEGRGLTRKWTPALGFSQVLIDYIDGCS